MNAFAAGGYAQQADRGSQRRERGGGDPPEPQHVEAPDLMPHREQLRGLLAVGRRDVGLVRHHHIVVRVAHQVGHLAVRAVRRDRDLICDRLEQFRPGLSCSKRF